MKIKTTKPRKITKTRNNPVSEKLTSMSDAFSYRDDHTYSVQWSIKSKQMFMYGKIMKDDGGFTVMSKDRESNISFRASDVSRMELNNSHKVIIIELRS